MATLKTIHTPAKGTTARQEAILRVVREEIATDGFENVTMDTLAEKAGVVKKTLYNLYGGKDELLLAAVAEVVELYLIQPSDVADGFQSILASRRTAIQLIQQNPRYATTMLQSLLRVADDHPLVQLLLVDSTTYIEKHLQVEAAAGHLIAAVDLNQLARVIVGQGYGAVTLLAKNIVQPAELMTMSLHELLALLKSVAQGDLNEAVERQLGALHTPTNNQLRNLAQKEQ